MSPHSVVSSYLAFSPLPLSRRYFSVTAGVRLPPPALSAVRCPFLSGLSSVFRPRRKIPPFYFNSPEGGSHSGTANIDIFLHYLACGRRLPRSGLVSQVFDLLARTLPLSPASRSSSEQAHLHRRTCIQRTPPRSPWPRVATPARGSPRSSGARPVEYKLFSPGRLASRGG